MAELILSDVLPVLFEKLMSPDVLNIAIQEGVLAKLKKWETTLKMIKELLVDAEQKQLTDEAVKMWLDELQDLAYDAEDILDEYATEALRRKLMKEEHEASTSKVRKFIPACCVGCTPTALWSDYSTRSKIDRITSRLEDLCKQKTDLGLEKIAGERSRASWRRSPTSDLPTERVVYGRDEEKAKILEMVLTDDEPGDANFGVIPIVGMGGIGKTTLAQAIYNDKAVEHFNPKAWVCLSDDFDVLRISVRILESITSSSFDMKEISAVHNRLRDEITGKKFLIVLDDVWSHSYESWQTLKSPFMYGARGSKIIVTTRLQEVALSMRTREGHELDILSDEDCWSLFMQHAFAGRTYPHWNLEVIRKGVVQKCKGLPLAARALGGILRNKETEDEWMDVLNSKIWQLPGGCDILPVLRLSFYHLPSNLKRCFAYCAIFPKDYEFEEKELVLLWMAEGLIQQLRDNELLEKIGGEYFRELVSRSIIQISDKINSKFIMHDLVNDLAQMVSRKLSFRLEDEIEPGNQSNVSENTRYASYVCHCYNGKSKFGVFNDAKFLRTHLPIPPISEKLTTCYISNTVVSNLLAKFKKLRVLSLQRYSIIELPHSVGSLKLLRYLNLSYSRIQSLPESINSMYNLQTLILRNCHNLSKLPHSMENLIKLRHFDILGASKIKEMPIGIRKWKSLRTLSNFIIGKCSEFILEDLEYLKFLCGRLYISRLENVIQARRQFILLDKQDLEVLSLEWGIKSENPQDEEGKKVPDILQPHKNLKELRIKGYGGTKFSSWVGDGSFSKMTSLKLEDNRNCTSLPSLGLLGSLKSLTIKGMKRIKRLGFEFYGGCSKPFRSLETLSFQDFEEWEHWDPIKEDECVESFPNLRELSIVRCPKLTERLPNKLPLLEKIVIRKCGQLMVSLSGIPNVCKLEIDECKKIVCSSPAGSSSLTSVSLSNVSNFSNWLTPDFPTIKALKVYGCDELIDLWQRKCFLDMPPQVTELAIGDCNVLTTLLEGIKRNNPCLEKLKVENCSSLTTIFRGQLPQSLKSLVIKNCEKLECFLEDDKDCCTSIMHKEHVKCSTSHCDSYKEEGGSLTCLPSTKQLSATLTSLHIRNCSKLTALSSTGWLPVTLKYLHIHNCSQLTTLLPSGQLPKALRLLSINLCPKLESIVDCFHDDMVLENIYIFRCNNLKFIPKGLHTLRCLLYIKIYECGGLVSFLENPFPNSIVRVCIEGCRMLEALPSQIHTYTSLQELRLSSCPSLSFPEGGLPTSLTLLAIDGVKLYKPLIEWGLDNLTSLRDLSICGGSFPIEEEEMAITLPYTLTRLSIGNFPHLKYFSPNYFQNVMSLEILDIYGCPNLASLPGLPPSLLHLNIKDCHQLKRECKRDEGKKWCKISDIPRVEIDGKFIYDP